MSQPRPASATLSDTEQVRALVPKRYRWVFGLGSVLVAGGGAISFAAKPLAEAIESLSRQPLVALALVLIVLVLVVVLGVAIALSVMWRTTVALRLRVETLLGDDRHASHQMLALVRESLEKNTAALARLGDKIDPFHDQPQTGATRVALDPKVDPEPTAGTTPFPHLADPRHADTREMPHAC